MDLGHEPGDVGQCGTTDDLTSEYDTEYEALAHLAGGIRYHGEETRPCDEQEETEEGHHDAHKPEMLRPIEETYDEACYRDHDEGVSSGENDCL